jgi:hypothetical protein
MRLKALERLEMRATEFSFSELGSCIIWKYNFVAFMQGG